MGDISQLQSSRAWIAILVILNILKWNEMNEKESVPASGGGAKIDEGTGGRKEVMLLVELGQLEGGTRAEALVLREVIVLTEELRIRN